jgi:mevalonate kinase
MKWTIPAKTFLLGEYAALAGAPAIILTTKPCFEISLSEKEGLHGIHPESPAGRWWLKQGYVDAGLQWHDPYQGRGGMGASSAQFLGAYLATIHLQNKLFNAQAMLGAYLQCAWSGEGTPPSGYDVLAQSLQGCVYIHKETASCETYPWPFKDIAFLLLHTGQKLATHQHLQTITLPKHIHQLASIVENAKQAFMQADSELMVEAVNAYHQQLKQMNLVAEHSLHHIAMFKEQQDILAVKGCGALGADVVLLLVPTDKETTISRHLTDSGWNILATSADLYTK